MVFELECIDRIHYNLYAPKLQRDLGVVGFIREHPGKPVASTAVLADRTEAFYVFATRPFGVLSRRLPARPRSTSRCPARVRLALIATDRKHLSMMLNGTHFPGCGPPPLGCGRRTSATYLDCLSSALAVNHRN